MCKINMGSVIFKVNEFENYKKLKIVKSSKK